MPAKKYRATSQDPGPAASRSPRLAYAHALDAGQRTNPDVLLLLESHHGSTAVKSALQSRETVNRLAVAGRTHIAMETPPHIARTVAGYESGSISRPDFVKELRHWTIYTDPALLDRLPAGMRKPNAAEGGMLPAAARILSAPAEEGERMLNAMKAYDHLTGASRQITAGMSYLKSLPPQARQELTDRLRRDSLDQAENFADFYDYARGKGMQFFLGDERTRDKSISNRNDGHFSELAKHAMRAGGGHNKIAFIIGIDHETTPSARKLSALLKQDGHSVRSLAVFGNERNMREHFSGMKKDAPDHAIEMAGGRLYVSHGGRMIVEAGAGGRKKTASLPGAGMRP